ncbi:MAG TPA: hypothetical protein VI457_16660 [Methylococcaceae bacterium]|nr:hypothetical protein [Methylococcaceae bacterium]
MRVLGGLIAIAIAVWFYRTAETKGANPIQWAIAGVIFYYVPMGLWTWLVMPKMLSPHPTSAGTPWFSLMLPTLVGLGAAFLLRQFVLLKLKPKAE